MRITLVGSRHFGVTTFDMLRKHGVDIVRVVVADAEDRLAAAAKAAGIEVVVQADPKLVVAGEIAPGTDLLSLLQGTDPSLLALENAEATRRVRVMTPRQLDELDF